MLVVTEREIYPSAPLRFAAAEVRFSYVPSLATEQSRSAIYQRLQDTFPIADATSVELSLTPGGSLPPQATAGMQMANRERTWSVTVFPTSLLLQTSAFKHFEDFFKAFESAVAAVAEHNVAALGRVGLRYIDEIRVPGVTSPMQWRGYVNEHLLGGVVFAGDSYQVDDASAQLTLRAADDSHVILRYGPANGFAVDPNGRLRLPPTDRGHFFLLDLDSFWVPADGEALEFDPTQVLEVCARLDQPAHDLFEAAITDKLRDEVMRRDSNGD